MGGNAVLIQRSVLYVALCAMVVLAVGLCSRLGAQTDSFATPNETALISQQLATLVPDSQDLPGFASVRAETQMPVPDTFDINIPASQFLPGIGADPTRTDVVSRITRCFYSTDGAYYIMIVVTLCQTPALASQTLDKARRGCSRTMTSGSFTSLAPTGDESWVPLQPRNDFILFRAGRVEADVNAGTLPLGDRMPTAQPAVNSFPASALQAVADDVVLRIMQQASLTGVTSHQAHIAINGKPLAGTALASGHMTFVPALAFARALGYQGRWNAKSGTLTLTEKGRPDVLLTADSTQATVGRRKVTLATPLLAEQGKPVGTVEGLAALLGGKVTRGQGGYRISG